MKVVYTAPNRGHHYLYAGALHNAGCLHAFVSGFPRLSNRSKAGELKGKLHRADFLQTLYLGSLKARLPEPIGCQLAYLAKIEQDAVCRKFVKDSDVFLYYNGSGLNSSRYGKKRGVINIVEAVNSHVEYQENLLQLEHKKIGLLWRPFPKKEKARRLKEYDEADYVLLPSEFVKRSFLAMGFPEEKLLKVPYGFKQLPSSAETNTNDSKKEDFVVLYVGSISVRKGVRYLIEAFKALKHSNKKLIIVGPDVKDGALNEVCLPTNVFFRGVLKGEELDNAYKSADVFCLASLEEGLALVVGEAISFGLPVIATNNTGADDVITDGQEGFLVQAGDSEVIRGKLQILADDKLLLQQMRSKAYAKSARLDGWEASGKNLVRTLRNVLP